MGYRNEDGEPIMDGASYMFECWSDDQDYDDYYDD